MMNEILKFLSACPYLDGKKWNICYLGQECGDASIEPAGKNEKLKRYTDGGFLKEARFRLVLRQEYGPSFKSNREIWGMCEDVERWINQHGLDGDLACPGKDEKIVSFETVRGFDIEAPYGNCARYSAEIRIVYLGR